MSLKREIANLNDYRRIVARFIFAKPNLPIVSLTPLCFLTFFFCFFFDNAVGYNLRIVRELITILIVFCMKENITFLQYFKSR